MVLLSRLWHGLVTFGCAVTIPEEEAEETKELLKPALITASLTNDLYSFEKEREDASVQNAVVVVMREHGCSEEEAREIYKERIRVENAKYVRVVKDIRTRTDLSDDVKRYIEVMQYTLSGNVAWSTQCPRCHEGAKFNELQLLRAEYGLEKYPAMASGHRRTQLTAFPSRPNARSPTSTVLDIVSPPGRTATRGRGMAISRVTT